MGKSQRNKGKRGECAAKHLLTDRDYRVIDTSSGLATDDIVATAPNGNQYSVEVKNQKTWNWTEFIKQTRMQANDRKLPWMLMTKIPDSKEWLVRFKDKQSQIWVEK